MKLTSKLQVLAVSLIFMSLVFVLPSILFFRVAGWHSVFIFWGYVAAAWLIEQLHVVNWLNEQALNATRPTPGELTCCEACSHTGFVSTAAEVNGLKVLSITPCQTCKGTAHYIKPFKENE